MDVVTSQVIKHYFDLLEKTLKDNNLLNKPAQIYNVDETWMAYEHRGSGNKAHTTAVVCVNVIGQAISPYVIVKDGPPDTKCTNSKNGWIDIDLFEHYIQQATPTDLR